MLTLIETDKKQTFFIGDIHGEFKAIKNWIKSNSLSNCNLIFCGDFGFGFTSTQEEKRRLFKTEEVCKENDVDCYIIRGNHDKPSYFNTETPIFDFKKIHLLSDYTVIQTPEHNILCVGGAISVDRINRIASYEHEVETLIRRRHYKPETARKKAKLYWWEDEVFVYSPKTIDELKKADIKIDTVATHNAPNFCQPMVNPKAIGWSRLDVDLENDLYEERNYFTQLYKHLLNNGNTITNWFYGHYHIHNFEIIEGTKFTGLDMGRICKGSGGVGGNFDMSELK